MTTIPERTIKFKEGLKDFCFYISKKVPHIEELTILEIGSWTGCSAEIFANKFRTVICVDPWIPTEEINTEHDMKEVERIFDNRVKKYNNVVKLKMTSEQAARKIGFVDIVYIDGIHSYEGCKKDLELWLPKTKLFIAGHDYWVNRFDGVIKAVNEMIGEPEKVFPDTSWIKNISWLKKENK